MRPQQRDEFRKILDERRSELSKRVLDIDARLSTPHDPDFVDQAIEREDDEVLIRQRENAEQEISRIGYSLDRIKHETYGTCAECGGSISLKRLRAVPTTPYCENCASPRRSILAAGL